MTCPPGCWPRVPAAAGWPPAPRHRPPRYPARSSSPAAAAPARPSGPLPASACIVAIAAAAFFIAAPGSSTPAPTPDTAADGPLARANLPIPRQVSGTWSGTIHQTNPSLIAVKLTLPGGSKRGTLAYPQLDCIGQLALVSARQSVLTFRLAITTGRKTARTAWSSWPSAVPAR